MASTPVDANRPLLDEVKALIVRELRLRDIRPEEIGDDDALFKDGLGLDSLDALELATALETHFHVDIPDDEAAAHVFRSARTIAQYVSSKTPRPSR